MSQLNRPMNQRVTWRRWGLASLGALALVALSSCGDDHCDSCYYGYAPKPSNNTASEAAFGLVAGDFANNSLASIVTTSAVANGQQQNAGSLKSYLATGPFTYAVPVLSSDGNGPLWLASADLNADHLPDLVSANFQDGQLAVFFNNASSPGTYSAPLLLTSPGTSQVVIADLNGDGVPDLLSADYNVSLFLGNATTGVTPTAASYGDPISLYSGGANWVAVGDLNGDGIPDVVLVDNVGVKLLLRTGTLQSISFAAPVAVYTEAATAGPLGANVVAIADVNGDGLNDLIISDPGPANGSAPFVAVLLQNPASPGTFLAPVTYALPAGSVPQSIQMVDVNADGHTDIVIGGSGAVSVLLATAASPGIFGAASNYPVVNAYEVAVADVNGDGLPDIIIGTGASSSLSNGVYSNTPGVLLQSTTSPGTFGALQNLP